MVAGRVSSEKVEQYNDDAYKNYNEKALVPCPNCARTFLPDRLDVHMRSCGKAKGAVTKVNLQFQEKEEKKSPVKSPAIIKRPKTLMCYIW